MSIEAIEAIRAVQVEPKHHAIIALDMPNPDDNWRLLDEVGEFFGVAKTNRLHVKVGTPVVASELSDRGIKWMFDLKGHDTDETVGGDNGGYAADAVDLGAYFTTFHGDVDTKTLEAIVAARDKAIREGGHTVGALGNLLGITILTSESPEAIANRYGTYKVASRGNEPLQEVPITRAKKTPELAEVLSSYGFEGRVAGAKEVVALSKIDGISVIPGMKFPEGEANTGQVATGTPQQAIQDGADFVVMGSAVFKAKDRRGAAQRTLELIQAGLDARNAA